MIREPCEYGFHHEHAPPQPVVSYVVNFHPEDEIPTLRTCARCALLMHELVGAEIVPLAIGTC